MFKTSMGPMGPRGLGPWALWAPGALGPNFKIFENLTKVAPEDLQRPLGHIPDDPKKVQEFCNKLGNFGSEPCAII